MQCRSCHFENMPGSRNCARCGALVELSSLVLDVCPPRAGAGVKRLRRVLPYHRAPPGLRSITDGLLRQLRPANGGLELTWSDVWRLIVPGWTQRRMGNVARGRAFSAGFLMAGALAVLLPGTTLGAFALGTAVAVHVSSIIDAVFSATNDLRGRVTYACLYVALVGVVVYLPLAVLGNGLASPRQVALDQPPVRAGQVVLTSPWLLALRPPAAGDLVLYRIPALRVAGRTALGFPAQIVFQGERIGRVLALPGQHVLVRQGTLIVDGQSQGDAWRELLPEEDLDLTVPAGHYLIAPATIPERHAPLRAEQWQRLGLVPSGNVLARVYARTFPPWRLSLAL
jgi:hypothetical protein